jgi:hypothetical protein
LYSITKNNNNTTTTMVHTTTMKNEYLATEDNLLTINPGMKEAHALEHTHEFPKADVISQKDFDKKLTVEKTSGQEDKQEEKQDDKQQQTMIGSVQEKVLGTYENLKEKVSDSIENLKEKVLPAKTEEKKEGEENKPEEEQKPGLFASLQASITNVAESVAETLHLKKADEEGEKKQ